jgi:copper chaperone NosL
MARSAGAYRLRFLAILLAAAACGAPGPRPLAYGTETCAHCHMTLADPRFSAELLTTTGRAIPFDDVGCLGSFVATHGVPAGQIRSLWVSEFLPPHALLAVSRAVFLRSDSLHTPMDYGIVALAPGPRADSLRTALDGELLSWDQVLATLRSNPGR